MNARMEMNWKLAEQGSNFTESMAKIVSQIDTAVARETDAETTPTYSAPLGFR
jgi:hypothetical protein